MLFERKIGAASADDPRKKEVVAAAIELKNSKKVLVLNCKKGGPHGTSGGESVASRSPKGRARPEEMSACQSTRRVEHFYYTRL